MNDEIVESLSEMLARTDSSTSFNSESIPRDLAGSRYIQKEFRAPEICPVDACRERCEVVEEDDQLLVVRCDDGHETETERSQHVYYNLDFKEILESVVDSLNREIDNHSDGALPRYVAGDTGDGLRIYLIVNPSEYENTINEICVDALADESPALLIAPDQNIRELLKRQALFASSSLIYSIPFSMVSEPEEIKHSLSTIQSIEDVEGEVLDEIESRDELVRRIDSNPRYILTELNHMRLLRIAGELPQSSGNRLERVAESAFSHLFATHRGSGREDNRGKISLIIYFLCQIDFYRTITIQFLG